MIELPVSSLRKLIEYIHPHEKRHFLEFIESDFSNLSDHIFYEIDILKKWLDENV